MIFRSSAGSSRTAPRNPWHAVSVVRGHDACPVAGRFAGKRFLSADAPQLPLPNCFWPARCDCTYRHYEDRRTGPRRADERGAPVAYVQQNRRLKRSRRAGDTA
jgi:hypothetical protein